MDAFYIRRVAVLVAVGRGAGSGVGADEVDFAVAAAVDDGGVGAA